MSDCGPKLMDPVRYPDWSGFLYREYVFPTWAEDQLRGAILDDAVRKVYGYARDH